MAPNSSVVIVSPFVARVRKARSCSSNAVKCSAFEAALGCAAKRSAAAMTRSKALTTGWGLAGLWLISLT